MEDKSYLDRKYFVDSSVYNCPFCKRNNVVYRLTSIRSFDWDNQKRCFVYFAECSSCKKTSMHLSYEEIDEETHYASAPLVFQAEIDIDSNIFYSVPTSFFVLDDRIPAIIRSLISEADGCLKMNFLTGASACMRKAIYELLIVEGITGEHYEDRIKALKKKYPESDPNLFDILSHIQDMTSDKIHEQSWDEWDSHNLQLIIETLKTVLHDIYVMPKEKADRSIFIQQLLEKVRAKKKDS